VGEVEVFVVLETRGPAHAAEVAATLMRAGYRVTPG
jgi:threonine dehydratase